MGEQVQVEREPAQEGAGAPAELEASGAPIGPPVVLGDAAGTQYVGGVPGDIVAGSVPVEVFGPGGDAGASGGPAAGDTAAALLVAGRKLFARHGYDGASVRAITAEAGANLGAITYHFGSKKALYNRVVEMCVMPLASRIEAALAQPVTVLDRIEAVIGAYFDHFSQNPDLPQLMLQEVVLGGGPPEAAGPPMRRIYGMIQAVLREGQASGEIRLGDPVLLTLSVISQPIFPMLVRRPVQAIAGLDLEDERTRERVVMHMVSFVRAGLAARPEEGR